MPHQNASMISLSEEFLTILRYARDEAMRTGCMVISADHLMLGLLRHSGNEACSILEEAGVDTGELKKFVDACLFMESSVPYSAAEDIAVSRSALNAISLAGVEAIKRGKSEVSSSHLLLSLSGMEGSASVSFLQSCGISRQTLASLLEKRGEVLQQAPSGKVEGEMETMQSAIGALLVLTYPSEGSVPS